MRGFPIPERIRPTIFGLASLLLLATVSFSQTMTTGDIVGTATDVSGAIVPNATVTIKLVDTNETHSAKTNTNGQYRFSLLQPGDYTVTADATGLKSKTEK